MKYAKLPHLLLLLTFFLVIISFRCMPDEPQTKTCYEQDPQPKNEYTKSLKIADHFLDAEIANKWIERYQQYVRDSSLQKRIAEQGKTAGAAVATPGTPVFPKESESFNRALIQQILCLDSCMGVRILFGINDNNEIRLLLGGIDQEGKLLYITDAGEDKKAGLKTTGKFIPPPQKNGLGEMGQLP